MPVRLVEPHCQVCLAVVGGWPPGCLIDNVCMWTRPTFAAGNFVGNMIAGRMPISRTSVLHRE